jgi:hypothetical protein
MIQSRGKIRFYIYASAFLPFILLLSSGAIMLYYHTGAPKEALILAKDGHFWLAFHKTVSIVCTPFILLHLFVKTNWVKNFFLFKLKGRVKTSNIVLFLAYSICLFTAIGSWLVFSDNDIASLMKGVHNKVGILLLFIFCIHVWNYRITILIQIKRLGNKLI